MSAIFSVTTDKLKRSYTLTIRDGSGVKPERHYNITTMLIDGQEIISGKGDVIEYVQGLPKSGIHTIRISRNGECLEEFTEVDKRFFKRPSDPKSIIFEKSYTDWFCSVVYPKTHSS